MSRRTESQRRICQGWEDPCLEGMLAEISSRTSEAGEPTKHLRGICKKLVGLFDNTSVIFTERNQTAAGRGVRNAQAKRSLSASCRQSALERALIIQTAADKYHGLTKLLVPSCWLGAATDDGIGQTLKETERVGCMIQMQHEMSRRQTPVATSLCQT